MKMEVILGSIEKKKKRKTKQTERNMVEDFIGLFFPFEERGETWSAGVRSLHTPYKYSLESS